VIMQFLILYAISVPIFLIVDMVWLVLIAQSFYQKRIGHLMELNWVAAILFYLLFLVGLTFFASNPAVEAGAGVARAAFLGAAFGFFTYLTYDMTNLATLKGWPVDMVVIDILWGSFLGAIVAAAAVYLYAIVT
jgi:uncharacterized membrane protein